MEAHAFVLEEMKRLSGSHNFFSCFILVMHGHFHVHLSPAGKLLATPVNIHKYDFVCVTTAQAISHGCIEDFLILTELDHYVQLVLNSTSTFDLPEAANIEVIPQCTYSRRMITAVRNLPQAPENIRSMFLTREFPVKQSRPKKLHPSSFSLDPSQRKALDKAIHSSFTIIEGKPGLYNRCSHLFFSNAN